MKTVFVLNNVVVSHGSAFADTVAISSTVDGAEPYQVPDASPVDVGWTVAMQDGLPVFTAPNLYPLLSTMQFYMAFTPAERMLIKALAGSGIPATAGSAAIAPDPVIVEFWQTFQMAVQLNSQVDPNLKSTQEPLAYLANPTAPTPPVIAAGRIPQILAGIAQ
ncbi:MAG TPA: hypothetical protein VF472_07455 [Burkholderiaceae bacterium]